MEKSWWNKFTDKQSGIDANEKRRRLTFYFMSYVGSVIMLTFAINSLGSGNVPLEVVLFSGVVLVMSNVLLSHFYPDNKVFFYIGGALIVMMIFALVITGGYNNTGLFWVFPFYAALFAVIGYRFGIVITIASLFGVIYLLYQPDLVLAVYSPEQISRFLAALVSYICIAFIGEYFWQQSHAELATDILEKQQLANTDPLTKLPNRRFLDAVYFERAMQNPFDYFPLTTVVVDIDHFKKINDTFGHDIGDKVLLYLSALMKSAVRHSDIVARTGGEEFLVLYPATSLSVGISLAEKIRQLIAESPFYLHDKQEIQLSASLGVASALTETSLNATLKLADENLYLAKQKGRNQVV